ncbi:predicted protein, partial [Postia placenta Mad-698-R]
PLSFAVPLTGAVAMGVTDSVHYQLSTEVGADEFAKLLPPGGHVVYIGSIIVDEDGQHEVVSRPYTVTLFHQLKCLDVIRHELVNVSGPVSSLTRHCMNYLRQSILCRPNLCLESAKNAGGTAARTYNAICRDWTSIYEEAERNQQSFSAWRMEPREGDR